jgi:hypothetical protein
MPLGIFKYLIISLVFFCAIVMPRQEVSAQDTILMVNGDVLTGSLLEEEEYYLVFLKSREKKSSKKIAVELDDIYSLQQPGKAIQIYYLQDTLDAQSWTVEEMRRYITGEQLAKKHYRPVVSRVGAFIAGTGGAYLGFAGLLIPVAYLGGMGMMTPSAKKMPEVIQDEVVIAGFRDEARRIRNRSIAKTILPGIVVGWTIQVLSGGLN